ncbi:MAG TPA: ABC transporter substrate-binding protein [Verrucomicrobiae bacterium]|nr:ABC transporter substrate-binding protein [Verrucomicrobiae bacterium]
MSLKKLALTATALVALGALLPLAPVSAADITVAVTAIVEHPALDACRDGIKDELKAQGFEDGKNITFVYESAQGNPGTAAQIAQKFVGENPTVIVPISTPSAQAVVAATSDIPVVFTAVTDPLGAKLITNLEKPGANVTGMSDLSPIAKHLALIKEVTPNAKKIGVPFNPGEANAVTLVELLKSEGAKMGYEIVEAPAPKSSDVLAAAQSLVGKSDVIYVPTDNTIVSALEAVIQVGTDNKLPVFAGDTDSVKRGAIAAVGFNYYDIGRQTGQIVARVLKGEKPGDIAVQGVEITELYVNPGAAAQMGVELSSDLVGRAKEVVK